MTYGIDEIKAAVSCRQLLEDNGIQVNRQGFAVCPFHGDRDASLKIYKGDRGWCCFGCHKGGDVINLARELYGLTFQDAVRRLGEDYGLSAQTASERKKAAHIANARRALQNMEERQRAGALDQFFSTMDAWLEADKAVRASADTEITDSMAALLRAREDAYIAHLEALERRDAIWSSKRGTRQT